MLASRKHGDCAKVDCSGVEKKKKIRKILATVEVAWTGLFVFVLFFDDLEGQEDTKHKDRN